MKNYVSLIEEPRGRSAREPSAIIRAASVIAAAATRPAVERVAASKTSENVRPAWPHR